MSFDDMAFNCSSTLFRDPFENRPIEFRGAKTGLPEFVLRPDIYRRNFTVRVPDSGDYQLSCRTKQTNQIDWGGITCVFSSNLSNFIPAPYDCFTENVSSSLPLVGGTTYYMYLQYGGPQESETTIDNLRIIRTPSAPFVSPIVIPRPDLVFVENVLPSGPLSSETMFGVSLFGGLSPGYFIAPAGSQWNCSYNGGVLGPIVATEGKTFLPKFWLYSGSLGVSTSNIIVSNVQDPSIQGTASFNVTVLSPTLATANPVLVAPPDQTIAMTDRLKVYAGTMVGDQGSRWRVEVGTTGNDIVSGQRILATGNPVVIPGHTMGYIPFVRQIISSPGVYAVTVTVTEDRDTPMTTPYSSSSSFQLTVLPETEYGIFYDII